MEKREIQNNNIESGNTYMLVKYHCNSLELFIHRLLYEPVREVCPFDQKLQLDITGQHNSTSQSNSIRKERKEQEKDNSQNYRLKKVYLFYFVSFLMCVFHDAKMLVSLGGKGYENEVFCLRIEKLEVGTYIQHFNKGKRRRKEKVNEEYLDECYQKLDDDKKVHFEFKAYKESGNNGNHKKLLKSVIFESIVLNEEHVYKCGWKIFLRVNPLIGDYRDAKSKKNINLSEII